MKTPPVFCPQCGVTVSSGSRFCSQCGSPCPLLEPNEALTNAGANTPSKQEPAGRETAATGEISWEVNVPLLTDQFIMYDLLKVWGISSLFLFVLLGSITLFEQSWRNFINLMPVLGLVSLGLLLLFILVMLLFFGNRFPMGFALNPQGAGVISLSRRGRWGNRLAVILGALAGKPGVAGAGLLGMAGENTGLAWDEVRRLNIHPETRVISLMNSWRVVVRLYCTPKNYDLVLQAVQKWAAPGLKKAAQQKPVRGLTLPRRDGLKSLLAAAAAFLMTALPLEVPAALIWALLAAGLATIWLKVFARGLGFVTLILVGAIVLSFGWQGLQVRQSTTAESFRHFALSQGVKVDQVPDWVIGRYRRFEHFHRHDWLQTGIAALGLSFFGWVGVMGARKKFLTGSGHVDIPQEPA